MELPEGNFAVSLHGLTITINLVIIVILLRANKKWNQLIERNNQLYKDFCKDHNIDYEAIK